jgi:putative ABC transport system permease protein
MLEIIRHLLRRKIRTSLTILAVAVGIFAVTAVGGIAEQLESIVQTAMSNVQDRIWVGPEEWDRPLTEATLRQLRRVEGVAGLTASISDLLEEPEEGKIHFYFNPETFSGTHSDIPGLEYEAPLGAELWDGRVPAPGSRTETVVGWEIAQDYGLGVGDIFVIRDHPFRVVGIWGYVAAMANPTVYISYDMAEELATANPFRGVGFVFAIAQPGVDLKALAEHVEAEVDGVQAQSPQEAVREARRQVLMFSLIVGASGIMALLIGSFTIVNTMIVSVHERRREIGLKKALGAANTHILAEVVAEAAFIGGMGGLLGVLAGGGVALFVNQALFDQLGMRLFLITPRLSVGAIVFTVLMGIVAGVYPAWQAARLDPVVALRGGGGATYAARGFRRLIYLIRRNARSILTVGGIVIGIFAVVVLGSLAEYLNGFLNDAIQGSSDKVAIRQEGAGVPFGRSTARIVCRVPGVRGVVLTGRGGPLDEEASEFEVTGRFFGIESPTGEYGFEMPMEVDFAQGRNLAPGSLVEVVVGADLAEDYDLSLGGTLTIRERDFTVVGIWERIPQDLSEFNSCAYISLDALALVLGEPASIDLMTALVASGHDAQEVAQAIEAELPGIETMTAQEQAGEIRQVLTVLIAVMAGLLSIAVFVGSVSVVNTMIIAVHERTREIGLKKAVGAEDTNILAEVLADAGKLGGLGGILRPARGGLHDYDADAAPGGGGGDL